MCRCTPAHPRFPRITPEQVEDLESRILEIAETVHKTHLYYSHFLPRILGQLRARSLASLTQPQYRAACVLLADDLAAARALVKHLKPALRAWERLQVPQRLSQNYVAPVPSGLNAAWVFDGRPFTPPNVSV